MTQSEGELSDIFSSDESRKIAKSGFYVDIAVHYSGKMTVMCGERLLQVSIVGKRQPARLPPISHATTDAKR